MLDAGTPARKAELSAEEWAAVRGLGLLSAKPVIYATNVPQRGGKTHTTRQRIEKIHH